MDSIIELQRRNHEERERLIDTMTRDWLHEKKTHKENVNSDHRLKMLLDRYMEATRNLRDTYEDRDGSRRDEIRAVSGPNEFAEFYARMKALKELHRSHPNEIATPLSLEFQEMNEAIDDPQRVETDMVEFTDEEGYGRYLDLHQVYTKYVNLKGVESTCIVKISIKNLSGGTLEERARRLFATKGKWLEEIDKSLFVKHSDQTELAKVLNKKEAEKRKEIAALEANVYNFAEVLSEQRAATKENVERKQARGPGEDDEEEEAPAPPSDDEDDDEVPYNPKNLPLGWDGKEWRHAHGMRCLGIPNTAHFANIVKISDAIELWTRLRDQKETERFKPDIEEEYEDTHGNVVNKKTFEDLLRQGLL